MGLQCSPRGSRNAAVALSQYFLSGSHADATRSVPTAPMQQRAAAAAVAAPAVPLPVTATVAVPMAAAYSGLSATGSSRDSGCSARTDERKWRWHGNKSGTAQ